METRDIKKIIKEVLGRPSHVKSEGSFKKVSIDFGGFVWFFTLHEDTTEKTLKNILVRMKQAVEVATERGYRIYGGYEGDLRIFRDQSTMEVEGIPSYQAQQMFELMEENMKLFKTLETYWIGSKPKRFADKKLYRLLRVAEEMIKMGYTVLIHGGGVGDPWLEVKSERWVVSVHDLEMLTLVYPLVRFASEASKISISGRFYIGRDAGVHVPYKHGEMNPDDLYLAVALMKEYGITSAEIYHEEGDIRVEYPLIINNVQNVIEKL